MKTLIGISGRLGSGKDTVAKIIQALTSNDKDFREYVSNNTPEYLLQWLGNYDGLGDWKVKKFADKLKDIVCMLIGCTRGQLEDQTFKNTPLGAEWQTQGRPVMTPRLMLQLFGTEGGRDLIHQQIWVNSMFADYNMLDYKGRPTSDITKEVYQPHWIVTDMRFANELKAVKDRGGITIRVTRDFYKYIAHTNEHQWGDKWDGSGLLVRVDATKRSRKESYKTWMTEKYFRDLRNGEEPLHASETSLDVLDFDYLIVNDSSFEDLVKEVKEVLITEGILKSEELLVFPGLAEDPNFPSD